MYRGVSAETPATDAAVAATAGQIVTYDGDPATTYFFASSGGHTENIEDAWPGASAAPWLRGVDDPYDGAGGDPYHRWTHRLRLAAAARQLGKLVKGKLVGIRVTRHGVSPRVISAVVIGTTGNTTVTGAQLQGAFGLLSTWASFTTISAAAGHMPLPASRIVPATTDLAILTQLKQAFSFSGRTVPALRGSVIPGREGDGIAVEVRAGQEWRKVAGARLGRGGVYSVRVPGAGEYRTVYRGLDGPSVVVP
jgi:stage II sporulation protein D